MTGPTGAPPDDAARRRLLRALEGGQHEPRVLALLSDEELSFLDQSRPGPSSSSPWLNAQELSVDQARTFGLRSLIIRGLVRHDGHEWQLKDDLRLALDMRYIGIGFLRATTDHDATGHHGAAHTCVVQAELGVFEEAVSSQGLHLFTASGYELAIRRMAAWVAPDTGAEGIGAPRILAPARWGDVLTDLDEATLVAGSLSAHFPGLTHTEERSRTWQYARDGRGAFITRSARLPETRAEGSLDPQVSPADQRSLADQLGWLVRSALAEARSPLVGARLS